MRSTSRGQLFQSQTELVETVGGKLLSVRVGLQLTVVSYFWLRDAGLIDDASYTEMMNCWSLAHVLEVEAEVCAQPLRYNKVLIVI